MAAVSVAVVDGLVTPVSADARRWEIDSVRDLSEKEWQDRWVIGTRKHPGMLPLAGFGLIYHTHRSDRSPKGFPDIAALRNRDGYQTLVLVELKRWDGKPTPEQAAWLEELEALARVVNEICGTVKIITGVWRPQDRDAIWEEIQ